MKTIKIDKTSWGNGPWQNEPDRLQWVHFGYACLIVRQPELGHFCGYVGVDNSHPLYMKEYGEANVDVHGGPTYSDKCSGIICHIPEQGMPDDVWWIGFDCAHSEDMSPGMRYTFATHGTYKDIEYVQKEVNSLAEQLRNLN